MHGAHLAEVWHTLSSVLSGSLNKQFFQLKTLLLSVDSPKGGI